MNSRILAVALILSGLASYAQAAECDVYTYADMIGCVKNDTTARLRADLVLGPGQQIGVMNVKNFVLDGNDNGVIRSIDENSARFNGNSEASGHFIKIQASSQVSIKNTFFRSTPATDEKCAYPGVYYNRFPCLALLLVNDSSGVTISGSKFNARKTFQLQLVDATAPIVTNNRFENASTFSIWMASPKQMSGAMRITDNYFYGAGANAILIAEVDGLWVGNNVFMENHRLTQYSGYGGGQLLFEDSDRFPTRNVSVTGNLVKASFVRNSHGIEFANFDRGTDLSNVSIMWNRFEGNGQSAIKFDASNSASNVRFVNISNNEFIYNDSPYKSQVIRSAFDGVKMGGNVINAADISLTSGLDRTELTCKLPIGATRCNIDIKWDVEQWNAGVLLVTVRSPGTQSGGSQNRQIFAGGITGTGQQSAPWISEGGQIFELFLASDYGKQRGWEAPVASILVRAVR